jgi:tRNA nucleotidyltransferase (CCA-adding enzyme)
MPEVQAYPDIKDRLPKALNSISKAIHKAGGTVYIVGGWVRDFLLGNLTDNYDLEVYGIELEKLTEILSGYGKPKLVGRAFGVVTMNIKDASYDFAFPRTESKVGKGHKGFMVKPDPNLTFEKAATRRDFTINAMGIRLSDMKLMDYYRGMEDLKQKILRHVSDAFGEDPLRALRAVQFAARFEMDITKETQKICALQPLEELPQERIFQELQKLLLLAKKPSLGLEWMRKMDLLRFFPELKSLVGVPQDPDWHPEGSVWEHNNRVLDAAAGIRDAEIEDKSPISGAFDQRQQVNRKSGGLRARAFKAGSIL